MRRRTLDITFSIGGVLLAGLLVVLALVMNNRADFSKNYVRDELSAQDIQFTALDKLDPREKAFSNANTGCAIANAGKFVTTGRQAECYANEVIGGHLTWLATRLGMTQLADLDGKSFRELGVEQSNIKAKITEAETSGDPALAGLEQRLTDVGTLRSKVFEGTMLRNALLTSYGFGELGGTADKVATVSWAVAAVLLLLALAGFVHALVTPKDKVIVLADASNGKAQRKDLTKV